MISKEYIDSMQERLDWCVNTERYELASSFRDYIKALTTHKDDNEFQRQYFLRLIEKYHPDQFEEWKEIFKNKYNIKYNKNADTI